MKAAVPMSFFTGPKNVELVQGCGSGQDGTGKFGQWVPVHPFHEQGDGSEQE